jgi:DNA-binding SARP family transcriptional activator
VLEQERDYPAAIRAAQRLQRHDPLHETTYRHLMRLYAVSGDRAAALRVFHTCATILERELGAEPSRATREVYERLMQTEESTSSAFASQAPLVAEAALIGRQQEWAQLRATWRTISKFVRSCFYNLNVK